MKRLILGLLLVFVYLSSWSAEPYVQDGFVCIPLENYKQLLMEQKKLRQNSFKLTLILENLLNETSTLKENTEAWKLISLDSKQIEKEVMKSISEMKVLSNDNRQDLENALTLTESASTDLKEVENILKEITQNVWIERIGIAATCLVCGFIIGSLL